MVIICHLFCMGLYYRIIIYHSLLLVVPFIFKIHVLVLPGIVVKCEFGLIPAYYLVVLSKLMIEAN